MEIREVLVRTRVKAEVLETWVRAGWLLPAAHGPEWRFDDIDLARAQLIRDLKADLGVNDDGVEVALDLIDQVHGLRRTLQALLSAVAGESEEVRRRIVAAAGMGAERKRQRANEDG